MFLALVESSFINGFYPFNEKHRKLPKLGRTQKIEDAKEQGLAPRLYFQALLWLAPCSSCWKTLLTSSQQFLESWGKQQNK